MSTSKTPSCPDTFSLNAFAVIIKKTKPKFSTERFDIGVLCYTRIVEFLNLLVIWKNAFWKLSVLPFSDERVGGNLLC